MDLKNPDSQYIQGMFGHLARRYDLFNRLTSLGLDTIWRREALASVRPGMRVLDLGCGTGDLALSAAKLVGPEGEVAGLDFSEPMLEIARKRAERLRRDARPYGRSRFILKRAEDLPIEEKPFDLIVSGFVLRNIYENIDTILTGVRASLREGGSISFLDLTEPKGRLKRLLWKFYMNTAVALCGKILFGRHYPVFYLTESARRFLKPEEFVKKLEEKGFEAIRVKKFLLGVIVLYQATKPVPNVLVGDQHFDPRLRGDDAK